MPKNDKQKRVEYNLQWHIHGRCRKTERSSKCHNRHRRNSQRSWDQSEKHHLVDLHVLLPTRSEPPGWSGLMQNNNNNILLTLPVVVEMARKIFGFIILLLIALEKAYDFADFIPSNGKITDCYIREVLDQVTFNVQCMLGGRISTLLYMSSLSDPPPPPPPPPPQVFCDISSVNENFISCRCWYYLIVLH